MTRVLAAAEKNTSTAMEEMKCSRNNLRQSMHLFTIITPFLLLISSAVFAQTSNIEVIRDPRVDTLVNRYKAVHRKEASIDGFRIQITE